MVFSDGFNDCKDRFSRFEMSRRKELEEKLEKLLSPSVFGRKNRSTFFYPKTGASLQVGMVPGMVGEEAGRRHQFCFFCSRVFFFLCLWGCNNTKTCLMRFFRIYTLLGLFGL